MLLRFLFVFIPLTLVKLATSSKDERTVRELSLKLESILTGIKNEDSKARQTWYSLRAAPSESKYSFLNGKKQTVSLCLVLSLIPEELRRDPRVKLVLFELNLYRVPNRQVKCILNPPSEAIFYHDYQNFIYKLPIFENPHEWRHILQAWFKLTNPLEKTSLLNAASGLTNATDSTSLTGQLCATQELPIELGKQALLVLPVFNSPKGKEFLKKAAKMNPCDAFFNKQTSTTLVDLLTSSRKSIEEGDVKRVGLDVNKFNTALANNLSIGDFTALIKFNVFELNLDVIYKLVDASDLLIRDATINELVFVTMYLINEKIPSAFFIKFLQRAGSRIKQNSLKYQKFMNTALQAISEFKKDILSTWYIDLTLFEPVLINQNKKLLPIWDLMIKPMEKGDEKSLFDLTKHFKEDMSTSLLELILAKTACITLNPLVEPLKCESLKKLVQYLKIPTFSLLNEGHWRMASLNNYTPDDLTKYLIKGKHSVPTVAWTLSKMKNFGKEEREALMNSNRSVVALTTLYIKFGKIPQACRIKIEGMTDQVTKIKGTELTKILEIKKDGKSLFKTNDKYLIIKSLISLITAVDFDRLSNVAVWRQAPVMEMFKSTINGYCSQWAFNSQPAMTII